MQNRNRRFLVVLLAGCSFWFWIQPALASPDPQATAKSAVEKVEKAILQASEMQEQGKLQKGRPLVIPIASDLQLVFTAENFNNDLNRAFQILDQLMSRAKTASTGVAPAPASPAAAASAHPSVPAATAPHSPPPDRLSALRDSEQKTAQAVPPGAEPHVAVEYSVYKNYQQSRQARLQGEEKLIEAEKQAVLAERQAAAQNQQRRRERDQQLQAQATAWQAELDKQAKASSAAALQWQQEHSFGAYVKRFLGMVVQTSVGAFTGGFLGTLSSNLANQAVSNLFPAASTNVYSQAAAAGTSAAITQTGTAMGQTAGQQAASAVTGSGSMTTPATTAPPTTASAAAAPANTSLGSGAGQIQYTPPKF